jgi:hypothetical protein
MEVNGDRSLNLDEMSRGGPLDSGALAKRFETLGANGDGAGGRLDRADRRARPFSGQGSRVERRAERRDPAHQGGKRISARRLTRHVGGHAESG